MMPASIVRVVDDTPIDSIKELTGVQMQLTVGRRERPAGKIQ
jgi:hypothetical protein